jgi:hypothetical protein
MRGGGVLDRGLFEGTLQAFRKDKGKVSSVLKHHVMKARGEVEV